MQSKINKYKLYQFGSNARTGQSLVSYYSKMNLSEEITIAKKPYIIGNLDNVNVPYEY